MDALVGAGKLLRGLSESGRLAVWAVKQGQVVRVGEVEAAVQGVCNVASSQLPSGSLQIGGGSYEVTRRGGVRQV